MYSSLVGLNLLTSRFAINVYILLMVVSAFMMIKYVVKSCSKIKTVAVNHNRLPKLSILLFISCSVLIILQYCMPFSIDFPQRSVTITSSSEPSLTYVLSRAESEKIIKSLSDSSYRSTIGPSRISDYKSGLFYMFIMDDQSPESLFIEFHESGNIYIRSSRYNTRIKVVHLSDNLYTDIAAVTKNINEDKSLMLVLQDILSDSMTLSREDSILSPIEIKSLGSERLKDYSKYFTKSGLNNFKDERLLYQVYELLDGHKAYVNGINVRLRPTVKSADTIQDKREFTAQFSMDIFVVFDTKVGKIRTLAYGDVTFKEEDGLWKIDHLAYDINELEKNIIY